MEKISHIVGGSPRMGSGDAKSAPPVRPGMPSFGRSIGDSPHASHHQMSTAEKVSLIRSDLAEQRKLREESRMATEMSERFFFQPEEKSKADLAQGPHGHVKLEEPEAGFEEPTIHATSARTESLIRGDDAEMHAPSKFAPRGSYIDLRA